MQQAEKSYLLALHHAEVVNYKWGSSTYTTVVGSPRKDCSLLKEYVESGDKAEACHCTQELNMPFSIMHGQEGSGVGYGGESSRSRDLGPTSGDCRQGTHHIQLNGQRLHKAAGGELAETCQCICDLDMPFFHHEVVKKALVTAMEKKNNHVLSLLCECSQEGVINASQMGKGFSHVLAWMTSLNIPDAKEKITLYMAQAKQ
ncbi:unnamed protein product [Sphagnum troendelagicum]